MLNIQRASAGSGKTYTLAKKYILNLIAFQTEAGTWKLRNERQIEDAMQHILAITFTNKATNEMKQRIVGNLSLLSKASSETRMEVLDKIPYLGEFQKILNVSYQEIGTAAAFALKSVLNNYSLFKISTIDSFFQEILRTFAFEANLNESYQLEIDSAFVSEAALDSAIHELDTHPAKMGNAALWLKIIMQDEAKKSQMWNPFNKNKTSRSIYARLKRALSQLEREDFKEIKDKIDTYFQDPSKTNRLPRLYFELRDKATVERDNLLKAIKHELNLLQDMILQNGYENQINRNFLKLMAKIEALSHKNKEKINYSKYQKEGSIFNAKFRKDQHPVDLKALDLFKLLDLWKNPSADSYYKNWKVYGELLPYLGLLLEVRFFLSQVLETNNLIQLSDTGFILKKIIGEEDAPFVYERLGNRIDHYLIDEFQDTSRMQWDIIYPLLLEGLAKDKESLIIGDPKQSIYRFRNADHRLITEVVPAAFPLHKASGMSKEDNTNWRSDKRIVKFNNFFFNTLASVVSSLSIDKGTGKNFHTLYSNVVQYPNNQEDKGYVEVRIFSKDQVEGDDSDSEFNEESGRDWFSQFSLSNIGPLISSLRKRGYAQKDIGVLVNTNEKGQLVVESLINYNASLPANERIDFLSEESLLISSSPAVSTIIGVIEKLCKPGNAVKTDKEPEKSIRYYNWNKIKTDYNIYSKQHGDLSPEARIIQFLNGVSSDEYFASLMSDLPVPSISAIVESAINTFLDHELRKDNAIYLASLQDIVNEYSTGHPNDPASFLEWWKARGVRMSITSPEGADAVQIMTIHKSKGLEFKCVIVPFATDGFLPNAFKEEWRWETPNSLPGLDFPPVLPVKTSPELVGSIHENIYKEYVDQVITDKLNMYYVAFTRAIDELYVFTKKPSKSSPSMVEYLNKILFGVVPGVAVKDEEKDWMMSQGELEITEAEDIITYGAPLSENEIQEIYRKDEEKKDKNRKCVTKYLKDYVVNRNRPKLRSKASRILPSGEPDVSLFLQVSNQ